MRVTVLGSGTAIPETQRFPACVLVQGGGETVLVDLGPGALRRLPAVQLGLESVTAVLFTHFHTDHTAGLPELLFALRNPRYEGRGPLRVIAAEGLGSMLAGLNAAWPRWLEPRGYELSVEEIGPGPFELGGLRVTAVPIEHTPQSLAYRLEDDEGAVVAVSGDASPCDGLVEVARGAGLFVCEASFPDGAVAGAHMSAREAGEAARRAGAGMLWLTHFYPEWGAGDPANEAASAFEGPIVAATDLLTAAFDPAAGRFSISVEGQNGG